MTVTSGDAHAAALGRLADDLCDAAERVAAETVDDAIATGTMPSLERIQPGARAGALARLVAEAGSRLAAPSSTPAVTAAVTARAHGRQREQLGMRPEELVVELGLLRRAIWRFVASHAGGLDPDALLTVERRLNGALDKLAGEAVVAHVEHAMSALAQRARRDPLTDLLNHQALSQELEQELDRGRRYGHGLSLVFFDIDRFKEVNDTFGHLEGDRVLRRVASILRESLRGSDLAGRMGGDEFAVLLLESDAGAAGQFVARLRERLVAAAASGDVPRGFAISPGTAHFPTDGADAETLFRVADERLYQAKRGAR